MYTIGAKVMAQWSDGGWYPATITQVGQGQFFVTYDDGFTAWLGTHQIQPAGGAGGMPGAFSVGMRVRSEYEGSWYSGTITQMGDGQYFVTYDDGDSAWKAAHELQPEAPMAGGKGMPMGGGKGMPMAGGMKPGMLAVGTRVMGEWSNGSWYPGTITQEAGDAYFVQFDDGDTAWLATHQIKPG